MRETTVKDICKIKSGKRIPKGYNFSECVTEHPYIRARDIKNGKINTDELVYIDDSVFEKIKRYIINTGDIAITIVGASIGDVGYASPDVDGFSLTENAVRLTEFDDDVNPRYIFYVLNSDDGQIYMKQVAGGAAQPKLGIYKVESIPILLPERSVQNKIVDVLSTYDSLIENNQKQIKLLEEAAQRLYKEWFVDLHFPGYENTKIVDGMPEGWRKSELQVLSKFVRGKTITRKDVTEGDIPVVAGGLEPAYFHNKSMTETPVITVSGSGANAGYSRMYYKKIWASDCSYIDTTGTNYIYFTYCFLKDNKKALDNLQKGAAQPHVYAKDINALTLKYPKEGILQAFENMVTPLFDNIAGSIRTIEILQQARDRLLPKLMSGELEV